MKIVPAVLQSVTVVSLLAATAGRAQTPSPSAGDIAPVGQLKVVNGDFGDLSGLTAGENGWHAGMPRGWQSESKDTTYAVNDQAGPSSPVCNVAVLEFLLQEVGTLTEAADVVLNFDVTSPWPSGANLGAALLDGDKQPLVNAEFQEGKGQRLVARKVPAGTKIIVEFWATNGKTPGLDNVTVETLAPGAASAANRTAAPAGQLRIANGDFSDLTGLKSLAQGGWYSGVPDGWESDSKDPSYAVNDQAGPGSPVCNVSPLEFLLQEAGTLTEASDVVLQFDVTSPWPSGAKLGAALLDGNRQPLVKGEFESGNGQKLVAKEVPAGTKIIVEFWALAGTTPALDNVTISK
jgi:hypothetical protein